MISAWKTTFSTLCNAALFEIILLFFCCQTKLPQTLLLQTTFIYYLTLLEVRSLCLDSLLESNKANTQGSARLCSSLEAQGKNLLPNSCRIQFLKTDTLLHSQVLESSLSLWSFHVTLSIFKAANMGWILLLF